VVVRVDGLVRIRVSDRDLFGHCERREEQIVVSWQGKIYALETRQVQRDATDSASRQGIQDAALTAPMPATVVKIAVQNGDKVEAQQPLVVLEAMKTEHVIYAPRGGTAQVLFAVGDLVPAGAAVARIETQ